MTSKRWRDVIFQVLGHFILHTLYIKKYVMAILHRIQALSCDIKLSTYIRKMAIMYVFLFLLTEMADLMKTQGKKLKKVKENGKKIRTKTRWCAHSSILTWIILRSMSVLYFYDHPPNLREAFWLGWICSRLILKTSWQMNIFFHV